jgi:hypothetical protein
MRELGRILMSFPLAFGLLPLLANGQDAPSLGEMARQVRQQKQQSDAPKTPKVISDDTSGAAAESGQVSAPGDQRKGPHDSAADGKGQELAAEQWRTRILVQKDLIRSTQSRVDKLGESINFRSPTHVRWNERQREKQQQLEQLQTQLKEQKKRLEEMQESARRQGYGNSVYDP